MIGRLLSILLCFPSRKRKSPKKSKGNAPSSELNTLTQPGNKTIPGSSEEPVVTTSEPGSNNPQSQWNNLRPDFQSARSSNSAGVSKAADTDKGLSINTTAISQGATSDIGIGNSRPSIESHGTSLQERNKTSSPVPSVRQDMHKLQREIQKELNRLKKPSDGPKSTIILHRDLMDFWSHPKWAPFIIDQSWWSELNDNVVHHVHPMTKYWKAFSILILVNFSEWDRFHSMFIYPQRSDSRLPFPLVDLIDETFLGSHLGSLFYEAQWAFCPFVITERQDPLVLRDMNLDCRFPFIAKSKKVGDGGSGFVSKQVVAPGYLRTNHGSSVNHKPQAVAVKVVPEKSVCPHEFINLKSLQRSLTNHRHIMVNIATIIRDQPIEGKMYYIIYDLADMDLEKFLTTSWLDNRKTRNNKSPRGRNFSYRVWPGELIMQIRHLADALDFLHNRMFDLERFTLVHNDLKPPNILVFYPNSADEDQRYPVGQWKIADFGLGKVKDSRKTLAELENRQSELHLHPNSSRPLPKIADFTHRQLSLTPAKRPAGKYTPPEVKEDGQSELNAKMGDVWAFGTVFSEVLAYAVDDVNQVLRLRKACQSDTEDRFFDPSTGELKKSFLDWMLKLHVKPRKDGKDVVWIQECTSLIKKILIRDASRRKSVAAIREDLDRIYWNHLEPKKLEWLSELQDDNRPSSRGSTDSPQEYDEEDYLRSPSSDTSRRGSFPPRVPTIHETHH